MCPADHLIDIEARRLLGPDPDRNLPVSGRGMLETPLAQQYIRPVRHRSYPQMLCALSSLAEYGESAMSRPEPTAGRCIAKFRLPASASPNSQDRKSTRL